jgi:hypothetical protein
MSAVSYPEYLRTQLEALGVKSQEIEMEKRKIIEILTSFEQHDSKPIKTWDIHTLNNMKYVWNYMIDPEGYIYETDTKQPVGRINTENKWIPSVEDNCPKFAKAKRWIENGMNHCGHIQQSGLVKIHCNFEQSADDNEVEEQDAEVDEVEIDGISYLIDYVDGTVYEQESETEVGRYDFKAKKWIVKPQTILVPTSVQEHKPDECNKKYCVKPKVKNPRNPPSDIQRCCARIIHPKINIICNRIQVMRDNLRNKYGDRCMITRNSDSKFCNTHAEKHPDGIWDEYYDGKLLAAIKQIK